MQHVLLLPSCGEAPLCESSHQLTTHKLPSVTINPGSVHCTNTSVRGDVLKIIGIMPEANHETRFSDLCICAWKHQQRAGGRGTLNNIPSYNSCPFLDRNQLRQTGQGERPRSSQIDFQWFQQPGRSNCSNCSIRMAPSRLQNGPKRKIGRCFTMGIGGSWDKWSSQVMCPRAFLCFARPPPISHQPSAISKSPAAPPVLPLVSLHPSILIFLYCCTSFKAPRPTTTLLTAHQHSFSLPKLWGYTFPYIP